MAKPLILTPIANGIKDDESLGNVIFAEWPGFQGRLPGIASRSIGWIHKRTSTSGN
jgi:hypothetical protein